MMERSPVGELRTSLWFLLGGVVGGAGAALLVLWPIGAFSAAVMPGAVQRAAGLLVVVAVTFALRGVLPLPRIKRQVRQTIGDLSPTLGAFAFGIELGSGLRTYTSSAALYLMLAPAALGTPLTLILSLGLSFGLIRGLVPLDRLVRKDVGAWDDALQAGPWILRIAPTAGLLAATALVVVGV